MKKNRYLNHLYNYIPKNANNYMLSTYSIILEAWRRGLEINIRIIKEASGNIEPYYSVSDGKKTHDFSVTRGDLVSTEAKNLTKNKRTTKEYLLKNDVSTPQGKDFDESSSNEDIIQYAAEIDYPVVVKPLQGTGGKGVIANIQNEGELIEALEYVRGRLKSPHIILESYFEGEDYRLYLLDGKVIGALRRIRAHVIGNGKNTVKELVEQKNKERAKLPSLTNRPIKIDSETKTLLNRKNLDLNSVIPEDEVVYLKSKNNISAGGDSIDITDVVSDNIKKIAIAATESFPSLPQCGLDMMVDEQRDTGVIIELNSRAHITQHLFPMKGQARDIPSQLIDYYFPETKNYNRKEANKFYIDYDFIFDACLSRTAGEIKIPNIPQSPIDLKRYVLSDCEYSESLALRVRRFAFNSKVNGYIKPLQNGTISIVAGGTTANIEKFSKKLNRYIKKLSSKATLNEKSRTSPVAHGFHIEAVDQGKQNGIGINDADIYIKKYSELQEDYQKLVLKLAEYEQKENVMELTKRQNKQLKKRLDQLETSTSWKVTKPLRSIAKFKSK
ncbi:ATP-grasp domain-containing protein [Virgibacillus ainsalahensis]